MKDGANLEHLGLDNIKVDLMGDRGLDSSGLRKG